MNERIKELMAQAGFDPAAIERMGVMQQAEKFAELIVRECISALDEADGSIHHSECLLEHFGVEE